MSILPSIKSSTIDILFRPSRFVQSRINTYSDSVKDKTRISIKLSLIFVFNLVLYSVPLTISGIETVEAVPNPPAIFISNFGPVFESPVEVWDFFYRLSVNAGFLIAASATALVSYHAGVVFLRQSEGILQSLHTIIYTSSIYLAGAFTLTWIASTADQIRFADDIIIHYQKRFIYFFIDLTDSGLDLPGGRPSPVPTSNITIEGQIVIFGLILMGLYFMYSLYLGARINHDMDRSDAILMLVFVTLSPAIYIIGSIVYSVNTI